RHGGLVRLGMPAAVVVITVARLVFVVPEGKPHAERGVVIARAGDVVVVGVGLFGRDDFRRDVLLFVPGAAIAEQRQTAGRRGAHQGERHATAATGGRNGHGGRGGKEGGGRRARSAADR